VIAGDFNMCRPTVYLARPYRPVVRGRTWPAWRPLAQVDHVLAGGDVGIAEGSVPPAIGSDHLPVRADPARGGWRCRRTQSLKATEHAASPVTIASASRERPKPWGNYDVEQWLLRGNTEDTRLVPLDYMCIGVTVTKGIVPSVQVQHVREHEGYRPDAISSAGIVIARS